MASWAEIPVMTVGMKVDLNGDGNIKQSGETVASQKVQNLVGVKATATLEQASQVYGAFIGTICGGSYDTLSASRSYKGGVIDD